MATNVPYSSSPTVEPDIDGSGATYQNVPEANANAFGAQIGQGMSNLAEATNKLGEHFTNIYMESTARDAATQTAIGLSDLESKFHQLRGNDAVNGLKQFQQDSADLIKKTKENLPMGAAILYDRDASSMMNNAISRAGSHAGTQAEEAFKSSLNGTIASNVNLFAQNANDPASQTYLKNIQDSALSLAHSQGLQAQAADAMVSHNIGEAYGAAIKTQLATNPDAAKMLYDQAMNGVIQKADGTTVPYLDADHRARIASEMGGEFRRQFQDQLFTARSYASSGADYDRDSLASAAKNAGHTDEYINAEFNRLDSIKSTFGSANARYDVDKSLKNDEALAMDGRAPVGNYDPATLRKAFPKEPGKVQDILNQVTQLQTAAGILGGMTIRTPAQNQEELDKLKPSAASPIDFVMQHEGGYVSNDSGKGPTNFGINQESNPDIDVKSLSKDQAQKIIKTRYSDAIGADKMSPAMASVAVDSAVNMGVGKTKELLAQAGDDPQKLIDLRRAEYQRLAAADPKRFTPQIVTAWNNRLDDLQKQLPALGQAQNYGEQSQLYARVQKGMTEYYKQLNDDPAGTITRNDQNLSSLYNAGAKDPTKMGAYIDAVSARQEALEVPLENRAILPQVYATNLTSQIVGNPQSAPATMNKLEQQFGDHWPQVYHSLVTQGGLPTLYQSIATLGADPKTERDGTLLARWAGEDTKGKTDEDLVGKDAYSAAVKTINGDPNLQSLMTSIYRSGGSKKDADGLLQSVKSLAFAKQFYDKDPNAAQDAIESFTSKYQFMPNGGARVPAKQFDAVNENAQNMLNNLENTIKIPPEYLTGNHGAITPKEYTEWVKNSPTWVTSPNENALRLKDPMDRLVRDQSGKPIEVSFNQVAPSNIGNYDPYAALGSQ